VFTGIIQAVGKVLSLHGTRLLLTAPEVEDWEPWKLGESLAVNGCCLTVVQDGNSLAFDLSEETLRRTNLDDLHPGAKVNLERAMRPSDRFGGHIVQGHVDAVGEVVSITPTDAAHLFRFRVPADQYLIDKGSIALNGVSLTIVEPQNGEFDVWIIPHTYNQTNFGDLKPGSRINVEYDVIAKHVEKLVRK
jgi:riboflavin synthase